MRQNVRADKIKRGDKIIDWNGSLLLVEKVEKFRSNPPSVQIHLKNVRMPWTRPADLKLAVDR